MKTQPSGAAGAVALLALALLAAPGLAADTSPILGGAELPLATVHLAAVAPVLALAAPAVQDQPPPEEPEPRPEPFPAPPEQPPAERPPDQPPPEPEEDEPDVDVDVAVPDEPELEVPQIEPPDLEVETEAEEETAWYLDPFWIIVALVFLVVILILIFSGRRR